LGHDVNVEVVIRHDIDALCGKRRGFGRRLHCGGQGELAPTRSTKVGDDFTAKVAGGTGNEIVHD